MARSKDRSESEYLRGVIRELKSEIRNLKKELSRANKQQSREKDLEDIVREYQEQEVIEKLAVKSNNCPKCKGKLEVVDLTVRIMYRCTCGYRRTVSSVLHGGKKEGI